MLAFGIKKFKAFFFGKIREFYITLMFFFPSSVSAIIFLCVEDGLFVIDLRHTDGECLPVLPLYANISCEMCQLRELIRLRN